VSALSELHPGRRVARRVRQRVECADVVVAEIVDVGGVRADRSLAQAARGVVSVGLGVTARPRNGCQPPDLVVQRRGAPGPGAGALRLDTLFQAPQAVVNLKSRAI
jgi:hypothetical protein